MPVMAVHAAAAARACAVPTAAMLRSFIVIVKKAS